MSPVIGACQLPTSPNAIRVQGFSSYWHEIVIYSKISIVFQLGSNNGKFIAEFDMAFIKYNQI